MNVRTRTISDRVTLSQQYLDNARHRIDGIPGPDNADMAKLIGAVEDVRLALQEVVAILDDLSTSWRARKLHP